MKKSIPFKGQNRRILTECPYCKFEDVEALQFDTDIEGVNPVATLPYKCGNCNKQWSLEMRPVKIHLDVKPKMNCVIPKGCE